MAHRHFAPVRHWFRPPDGGETFGLQTTAGLALVGP